MNDLPVFSPTIAAALVDQGFKIKKISPNYRDPAKRVYFFERAPELEFAFKQIVEGRAHDKEFS